MEGWYPCAMSARLTCLTEGSAGAAVRGAAVLVAATAGGVCVLTGAGGPVAHPPARDIARTTKDIHFILLLPPNLDSQRGVGRYPVGPQRSAHNFHAVPDSDPQVRAVVRLRPDLIVIQSNNHPPIRPEGNACNTGSGRMPGHQLSDLGVITGEPLRVVLLREARPNTRFPSVRHRNRRNYQHKRSAQRSPLYVHYNTQPPQPDVTVARCATLVVQQVTHPANCPPRPRRINIVTTSLASPCF